MTSPLSRRRLINTTVAATGTGMAAGAARAASTAARPSAPRVVDVREFGATGDGTTNDGPAINKAIRALRDRQSPVDKYRTVPKLLFPAGIYAVDEPINITELQAVNALIDGDSSTILGRCAGQPVIDALGARWLTVRDLTIVGDSKATPKLGMQIGRLVNRRPADGHQFDNVKLIGHYTLASFLNTASETAGFNHVFFWNEHPDPNSYCLIQDGLSHFGTTTAFVPGQHATPDRDASFNDNEFFNCDFRHSGGGVPVWLGDTRRHRFYRCYAAGTGAASFVVFCGPNGHTMLDVDCHCETNGLRDVFVVTGRSGSTTVRGFSFKDQAPYASRAVFSRAAPIEHVTLEHARIEIGGFPEEGCRVLDDPSGWLITGTVYCASPRQWNGETRLAGTAFVGPEVRSAPGGR